jgi:hypothetical protein
VTWPPSRRTIGSLVASPTFDRPVLTTSTHYLEQAAPSTKRHSKILSVTDSREYSSPPIDRKLFRDNPHRTRPIRLSRPLNRRRRSARQVLYKPTTGPATGFLAHLRLVKFTPTALYPTTIQTRRLPTCHTIQRGLASRRACPIVKSSGLERHLSSDNTSSML